jgi:hypothetical protein
MFVCARVRGAQAMLKIPRDGIHDAQAQMDEAKKLGFPLAYVGDVVGTGSSRKSATNSILWYVSRPHAKSASLCAYDSPCKDTNSKCATVGAKQQESPEQRPSTFITVWLLFSKHECRINVWFSFSK